MSKQTDPRADERLAQFTDRLLAGESPAPDPDPELAALQETVRALRQSVRADADPAFRNKLQRALQSEWRKREETRKIVRGIDFMRLGLVMTSLAILIAAALLLPGIGAPLTGAAGARPALVPLFVIGIAGLLGAGLYLILRRKK